MELLHIDVVDCLENGYRENRMERASPTQTKTCKTIQGGPLRVISGVK